MTAWLEEHKDFIAKEEGWWPQCDNWWADNNSMWVSETCTSRRWIAPCDSQMHFLMWSAGHNIPLCGETVEDISEIPVGFKAIPPTVGKYTMEEQDAVNTIANAHAGEGMCNNFSELCDLQPRLESAMKRAKDKRLQPNKTGDSETKERQWAVMAEEYSKLSGSNMTASQARTFFGMVRGIQQQSGTGAQTIYASADGWLDLKQGKHESGCDLINNTKHQVMELKAHDNTTTGKHRGNEKKKGYQWAQKHGYEYIYGFVDRAYTDTTFHGDNTLEDGCRILSKKELARELFGVENAFELIWGEYFS